MNVNKIFVILIVLTAPLIVRAQVNDTISNNLSGLNGKNVVDALSGRCAGVQVINPTGIEGISSRILIRGNQNITTNNQPLFVIDDVPMYNDNGLADVVGADWSFSDWGTMINNINLLDIENVYILKGAEASIYGSRGGNGVVIINTNKGKKQNGLGITYSISYRLNQPYLYRNVQNKYGMGVPDGYEVSSSSSWGPEMDGSDVSWWDGQIRPYSPQPDNLALMYHNSNQMVNNLSFQNAGDFGLVRVSFTDSRSNGIIDNNNSNQTTFYFGTLLNISKKVRADISFTYLKYNRNNCPVIGVSSDNISHNMLVGFPRSWKGIETVDYENEDGTMKIWDNYPYYSANDSLFWNLYNHNIRLTRHKAYGSVKLIYDITDWLSASARTSVDFDLDLYDTRYNASGSDGIQGAYYKTDLQKYYTLDGDFNISAHKNNLFDSKFSATLTLGGEMYYNYHYGLWAGTGTWANPGLFTIYNYTSASRAQLPGEYRYELRTNSVYGLLNLNWDNYLYLALTGRNDWTSALPIDNCSYFYPSVELSFVPTNAFNIDWKFIDFLELKAAYGLSSVESVPYQLDYTYNAGLLGGYSFSTRPIVVPAVNLKPEIHRTFEGGFNVGMWNRFGMEFTCYNIYSYNLMLLSPKNPSSGAAYEIINAGEMSNRGVELTFGYDIVKRSNMNLQTGINFAINKNRVESLSGAEYLVIGELWGAYGPAIAAKVGDSYGTIYGWDYVYTYIDADGNEYGPFYDADGKAIPLVNADGRTYAVSDTRKPVGNTSPKFYGGLNLNGRWKNFSFNILIDTKIGGEIYSGTYMIAMQTGQSPETLYERDGNSTGNQGVILNGFIGVDENGDPIMNDFVISNYDKYILNYGGKGDYITPLGVFENSWVKLRELSLTYSLPESIVKKQKGFQQMQISLVGRDLFYIYKSLPDNISPEGTMGAGNAQGLEYAFYPDSRSFMISLKIGF